MHDLETVDLGFGHGKINVKIMCFFYLWSKVTGPYFKTDRETDTKMDTDTSKKRSRQEKRLISLTATWFIPGYFLHKENT